MKKKTVIIILAIILAMCIAFIFSNSLKNGAETISQSGMIKDIFDNILDFLKIDIKISEQNIRTLGHFAEFFALSCVLTVSILLIFPFDFKNPFTGKLFVYFLPIAVSAVVALIDEFIQLFSPGRACDILDVLVDVTGATAANLIIMGIVFIIYAIKKRKSKD